MNTLKCTAMFVMAIALPSGNCAEDNARFEHNESCQKYIDLYFSFRHEILSGGITANELTRYINVARQDINDGESLKEIVEPYLLHESNITDVTEYSARCISDENYASLSFKIRDVDPRFNRLYVLIVDGKINNLSKETVSFSETFDKDKIYVKITGLTEI